MYWESKVSRGFSPLLTSVHLIWHSCILHHDVPFKTQCLKINIASEASYVYLFLMQKKNIFFFNSKIHIFFQNSHFFPKIHFFPELYFIFFFFSKFTFPKINFQNLLYSRIFFFRIHIFPIFPKFKFSQNSQIHKIHIFPKFTFSQNSPFFKL